MQSAPPAAPDESELSSTRYLTEVLHLSAEQSEDDVVDELIARAEALGIATVTRPSTPEQRGQRPTNSSSANSAATSTTAATTGHVRSPRPTRTSRRHRPHAPRVSGRPTAAAATGSRRRRRPAREGGPRASASPSTTST